MYAVELHFAVFIILPQQFHQVDGIIPFNVEEVESEKTICPNLDTIGHAGIGT